MTNRLDTPPTLCIVGSINADAAGFSSRAPKHQLAVPLFVCPDPNLIGQTSRMPIASRFAAVRREAAADRATQ